MTEPVSASESELSGDCGREQRLRALDRFRSQGLDIIEPEGEELFIDIDTAAQRRVFDAMFPLFERDFGAVIARRSPSRSGKKGREHIVVSLPGLQEPLQEFERVAMQAALGSDPRREYFTIRRLRAGAMPANIFVERKR